MEVNVVRFTEIVSRKNSDSFEQMHKISYLYIFFKICKKN